MSRKIVSLDDVLNDYLNAEPKPSYEALERWANRFPQYRNELSEFTAAWSRSENAPEPDSIDEIDEETLLLRAMSIVGDRLYARRSKAGEAKATPFNLIAEVENKGISFERLAGLTNLSVPIISKIAKGFLEPFSVPEKALKLIADALDSTPEEVLGFVKKQPMLAGGTRFKSQKQPILPKEKENFFDAVRNDRELNKELKQYWLKFENDESEGSSK